MAKTPISIRLDSELLSRIDQINTSRTEFIEQAIKEKLGLIPSEDLEATVSKVIDERLKEHIEMFHPSPEARLDDDMQAPLWQGKRKLSRLSREDLIAIMSLLLSRLEAGEDVLVKDFADQLNASSRVLGRYLKSLGINVVNTHRKNIAGVFILTKEIDSVRKTLDKLRIDGQRLAGP